MGSLDQKDLEHSEKNYDDHHITKPFGEISDLSQKDIEPDFSFDHKQKQKSLESEDEKKTAESTEKNKEIKNSFLDKKEDSIPSMIKIKNNKKSYLGRKRKGETRKVVHTKFAEDNLMRKLKTNFINYVIDKLNSSLSLKNKKFLNIAPKVGNNLTVDYNKKLMEKSIKTILEENPINKKYLDWTRKNYNISLFIKEIEEKNKEIEVINILNSSYIEYLDFMRKNNLQEFKDKIYNKAIRLRESKENSNEIVNRIVKLLFDYENWFYRKMPRCSNKNKNK